MDERSYLFRGDDHYQGGPIGLALGEAADAADIQVLADHVLRKEAHRTSRYTSFAEVIKIARRFTSAEDNRNVRKVEWRRLRDMASQGLIRVWDADLAFAAMSDLPKKLARQAMDVRTAMRRNREVLIEGQIPTDAVKRAE